MKTVIGAGESRLGMTTLREVDKLLAQAAALIESGVIAHAREHPVSHKRGKKCSSTGLASPARVGNDERRQGRHR
jgi:hypothetical protein